MNTPYESANQLVHVLTRHSLQQLKLNKLHQTQVHEDGPRVWGMLEKVTHLVRLQRIRAEDAKFVTKKPDPLRKQFGLSRWEGTPYY